MGDDKGVTAKCSTTVPALFAYLLLGKKKVPIFVIQTYNYHTVPLRGSRLRRGHKGVMSTAMGRPCGRALPLFNVVLRSTSFAWALGDTYRISLDCLERVSAQGRVSNVHRWYTDPFYHRGDGFLRWGGI